MGQLYSLHVYIFSYELIKSPPFTVEQIILNYFEYVSSIQIHIRSSNK